MTDKITKALSKFTSKELRVIKEILEKIEEGKNTGLQVAKLKGHADIFRVRKGNLRIIYRKSDEKIKILTIERRSEKTYRQF